MTAVLQINTIPTTALRTAESAQAPAAARHPAHDSRLSVAASRRLRESRPVRARSVVAALVLGVMIGALAWMQADAAGSAGAGVDDPKVDAMTELVAAAN